MTPSCGFADCTGCLFNRESPTRRSTLTFYIQNTATPAYLNSYVQTHDCAWNLHSSSTPLLVQPSRRRNFTARGFHYSAPAVWNSLPRTVLDSSSLTVFKSRLKTRPFHLAHNDTTMTDVIWSPLPPPLNLRPYGGIDMCYYYYQSL